MDTTGPPERRTHPHALKRGTTPPPAQEPQRSPDGGSRLRRRLFADPDKASLLHLAPLWSRPLPMPVARQTAQAGLLTLRCRRRQEAP